MERIHNALALVRLRLWLFPLIIASMGLVLAYLALGPLRGTADGDSWWIYSGDAGSARDLLSALLSGMITLTSLVISLTFVSLTLAANQHGPRLIFSFIRDLQVQGVIGLFLATIVYVILVLRTITEAGGVGAIPHLAVSLASALTLACMGALLFYVHKVSRSIIADSVIESVGDDLEAAIRNARHESYSGAEQISGAPVGTVVSIQRTGYVQTLDYNALTNWADQNDAELEVKIEAGEFVINGGEHLLVRSHGPCSLGEDSLAELRSAIVIGSERSPAQDVGYSMRQLVEIAVRALSPGINDPFTAIAAIDKLAGATELLLRCECASDTPGTGGRIRRVNAKHTALRTRAADAFVQIRQAADQSPTALEHLARTYAKLARTAAGGRSPGLFLDLLNDLQGAVDHSIASPPDHHRLLHELHEARSFIVEPARPAEADRPGPLSIGS